MKLLEKIDKLLVDGQEQVSPEIASEYTDFELITNGINAFTAYAKGFI